MQRGSATEHQQSSLENFFSLRCHTQWDCVPETVHLSVIVLESCLQSSSVTLGNVHVLLLYIYFVMQVRCWYTVVEINFGRQAQRCFWSSWPDSAQTRCPWPQDLMARRRLLHTLRRAILNVLRLIHCNACRQMVCCEANIYTFVVGLRFAVYGVVAVESLFLLAAHLLPCAV